MQSVVWFAVVLVAGVSAVTPAAGPQVSPWIDTSLCDLADSLLVCQLKKGQCFPVNTVFSPKGGPVKAITDCANTTGVALGPQFYLNIASLCDLADSLLVCQLKKGQCFPVNTVFSPKGGPVKAITDCANTTGVALGPQFYLNIGLAFVSGSPESLADKTSSDPNTVIAIRRCALNATGLLNADMMTLNRTAVAASLSSAFRTPALGAAVASAITSCPEPVDYKITDFITCLRSACMDKVSAASLMKMATTMVKTMTAAPPTGAPASA
ncbi:uncharacterized protein LOC134769656 [Penaeus indicus]|uniref:uncharacterized protein LOC134769656 n=1 Tax=Penaeus indicus TaxID=29960 RepID=UPI00300C61A7